MIFARRNAADNNKKGVVGRRGTKIPIMPNTSDIVPVTV